MGKWSGGYGPYKERMEHLCAHGLKLVATPDIEYHFVVPTDEAVELSDFDKAVTLRVHQQLGWVPKAPHTITPGVQVWLDSFDSMNELRRFISGMPDV